MRLTTLLLSILIIPALSGQNPEGQSDLAGSGQTSDNYVITPLDYLEFRILGEPETETFVRVSADGTVLLPYIGSVKIADRTVTDARDHLFETYNKDYYVNPQIDISVRAYKQRRVLVQGMVNNQGFVLIPPEEELTLLGAIAEAGGWSDNRLANRSSVVLTRVGKDGEIETHEIDATEIGPREWILKSGDIIEVPERRF